MSKLKTVWDAVNELRGVLSLSKQAKHHTHLASCRSGAGVYSVYASDVRSDLVVCTIAEFNALVEEMKIGLSDNPINHSRYLNYVIADKTILKNETKPDYTSLEFWKDAPDGAEHYMPASDRYAEAWVKNIADDSEYSYTYADEKLIDWQYARFTFPREAHSLLIPRPQSTPKETPEEKWALDSIVNNTSRFSVLGGDVYLVESGLSQIPSGYYEEVKSKMFLRADVDKNNIDGGYLFRIDDYSDALNLTKTSMANKPLVYTQEMVDNGELPSVGMECIAESKGIAGGSYLVTVSQINDKGQFACIDDNGDYLIHYPNECKLESFKPIDQRTKKEKAIDDIRSKCGFNKLNSMEFELLSKAYDEWVGE